MKEIWVERFTPSGLSYFTKKTVRSRKHKEMEIDIEAGIDIAAGTAVSVWIGIIAVYVVATVIKFI